MNIYLDIDGVILANDKQPALHVHEFIKELTDNYNVYWLTTHCHGNAQTAVDLLSLVLEQQTLELCKKILPTDWNDAKTEGIDFSQPFFWIDDDLYKEELIELVKHDAFDSWVEVNLASDQNQLPKVMSRIKASQSSKP